MSWTSCIKEVWNNQTKPMHQITHWSVFIATGLVYVLKTVEGAAAASYELILANPEIASQSWLTNGFFM